MIHGAPGDSGVTPVRVPLCFMFCGGVRSGSCLLKFFLCVFSPILLSSLMDCFLHGYLPEDQRLACLFPWFKKVPIQIPKKSPSRNQKVPILIPKKSPRLHWVLMESSEIGRFFWGVNFESWGVLDFQSWGVLNFQSWGVLNFRSWPQKKIFRFQVF